MANIIVMNRGDSHKLFVTDIAEILEHEGCTDFSDNKVYFGLMIPHQHFEDAILKKTTFINNDTVEIDFKPEDTVDLLPGTYFYQIKIRVNPSTTEDVYTIVNKTKLILND